MAESSVSTPPDLPKPPPDLIPEAVGPAEDQSKWPKVIGVISLIYAVGGMLCGLGSAGSILLTEQLMAMGGISGVDSPALLKLTVVILFLFALFLGIMLLVGAVKLLQRKRSGVKLHLRWAVLRMALMLVASLTMLVTANLSVDLERTRLEATNRMLEEKGQTPRPIPGDEALYRKTVITAAVFSGAQAIYPLFIGFYLSRRKIRDEAARWPAR